MENDKDKVAIKKPRGFALLDPQTLRLIAQSGGRSAHAKGTAHEYQKGSELARSSGRKGGVACHAAKRTAKEEGAA
jgi:general stress protein YciG